MSPPGRPKGEYGSAQRERTSEGDAPLLQLHSLQQYFPVRNLWGMTTGAVRALDDVSLDVQSGETLGIVGESGCGKSTLAKAVMGIHRPTGGEVVFEGQTITRLAPAARRAVAPRLQYVYQDPGASLDPRWKVRRSLDEPLRVHGSADRVSRSERIARILDAVGLPRSHLDLYPHELSGGQQRRVGLARILTLQPSLVILDEPTSGLDVSVQATVLKLLLHLRSEFALTYVFISHDLAVVRIMCTRVAVMYLGRIVEIGETEQVFTSPHHPYTQSLLNAIPVIGGPRVTERLRLEGEPTDPAHLPSGCRFRPRCSLATEACARRDPALRPVGNHMVACNEL